MPRNNNGLFLLEPHCFRGIYCQGFFTLGREVPAKVGDVYPHENCLSRTLEIESRHRASGNIGTVLRRTGPTSGTAFGERNGRREVFPRRLHVRIRVPGGTRKTYRRVDRDDRRVGRFDVLGSRFPLGRARNLRGITEKLPRCSLSCSSSWDRSLFSISAWV